MAGRRFTRGVQRGARRMSSWLEIPWSDTNLTAAGGTIVASLTTAEKAKRPFTIVRTHMLIGVVTDQVVATEDFFGAVGMCVVSDQASAAGAASVPTPDTDAASDLWFLHQYYMGEFRFGTNVGFQNRSERQYQIDSKAMRKVNEDEDVLVIAELNTTGSGHTVSIAGRLLIKEH